MTSSNSSKTSNESAKSNSKEIQKIPGKEKKTFRSRPESLFSKNPYCPQQTKIGPTILNHHAQQVGQGQTAATDNPSAHHRW
jgi:hypothetical protein